MVEVIFQTYSRIMVHVIKNLNFIYELLKYKKLNLKRAKTVQWVERTFGTNSLREKYYFLLQNYTRYVKGNNVAAIFKLIIFKVLSFFKKVLATWTY